MIVSGNDDSHIIEEEFDSGLVVYSDSSDNNTNRDSFDSVVLGLDSDFVSEPNFSDDFLRNDYEATTLSSDRATGTIDYSGYFENFTVLLIFLLACNIALGLVISFILGVKK